MAEEKVERGRTRAVLGYFYAYPGRVITIQELEKHFKKEYNRNQLMATMAYICNPDIKVKYFYPVERLQTGVWRLVESTPLEASPKAEESPKVEAESFDNLETLTVTIIKEVDNEMVVVDDHTNIYRMVRVA